MSCQASSLCRLPQELFKIILEFLEDDEISWLRLTCKNVRDRTFHRFRGRFTCRETNLSVNSLQRLIDISNHEQFGSAIQTVTVVAVVYDTAYLHELVENKPPFLSGNKYNRTESPHRLRGLTPSEVAQARWEQGLLSQLEAEQHGPKVREVRFGYGDGYRPVGRFNVAEEEEKTQLSRTMLTIAFCQLGRLKSLVLEAAVYKVAAVRLAAYKCTNPSVIWEKASYVFCEVMSAIVESRMIFDQLNIYGGPWGCSVSCDIIHEIVGFWTDQDRENTLQAVKKLSLCLSTWKLDEGGYPIRGGAATTVEYHRSLAGFLALCPNVEELEILAYKGAGHPGFRNAFQSVAQEVRFFGLRSCTLGGLMLRETDLIRFLQDNRGLEDLKLQCITLVQGNWTEFFRCCSNSGVELKMLTVQHLCVPQHEVPVENEDENGVVRILGEELKRGIKIRCTAGLTNKGKRKMREKYGPPECVRDRH